MSKFNALLGFTIIGAVAIIAGSTAAVAIHSNNTKLVDKASKANNQESNKNSLSTKSNSNSDTSNKQNKSGSQSNHDSKSVKSDNGPSTNKSQSPNHNNSEPPVVGPGPVEHNKNNTTNPTPSPKTSNEQTNSEKVVSLLDSLLSNIIDVAKYNAMNSNTVQEAFNVKATLNEAIKSAIENEIQNDANKFLVINSSYSINNIVDNIEINLPLAISATDIEYAQISNVNLSYKSTLLTNTLNSTDFTVEGFKSTISSSDIQSINQQIAQMIEKNVDKVVAYNLKAKFVLQYLFNEGYVSGKYYDYQVPNAILISGVNTITAGEALNIQSYKSQWINALDAQIIGTSNQTFSFNGITFTESEIAANLTVNVDQWQYVNNRGEITGITLSYAGIDLTFKFVSPSEEIAQYVGNQNPNEINIFGFYGFYTWQGTVSGVCSNGGSTHSTSCADPTPSMLLTCKGFTFALKK